MAVFLKWCATPRLNRLCGCSRLSAKRSFSQLSVWAPWSSLLFRLGHQQDIWLLSTEKSLAAIYYPWGAIKTTIHSQWHFYLFVLALLLTVLMWYTGWRKVLQGTRINTIDSRGGGRGASPGPCIFTAFSSSNVVGNRWQGWTAAPLWDLLNGIVC